MREILFRAKRLDNGGWVTGDLIHRRCWGRDYTVIRCFDSGFDTYEEYEVDPETICQYTGLTDKNGVKIFEGDIIKACDNHKKGFCAAVEWCDTFISFSTESFNLYGGIGGGVYEIVGNIHDKEKDDDQL